MDSFDTYVLKLDNQGGFKWLRRIESTDRKQPYAADIKYHNGHVYFQVSAEGDLITSGSAGSLNLNTQGQFDMYLFDMDTLNGDINWYNI